MKAFAFAAFAILLFSAVSFAASPSEDTVGSSPEISQQPSTQSAPSGGASSNGGGAFRASAQVLAGCAGRLAEAKVNILQPGASARVEIIRIGSGRAKLLDKAINASTTLSFMPDLPGDYELRVSVGADQTTSTFTVSGCRGTAADSPQAVATARLSPETTLMLSKQASFPGGISRGFKAYRTSSADGGNAEYHTEVTLTYVREKGDAPQGIVVLRERVPLAIATSPSQVSFATQPSRIGFEGESMLFEWDAGRLLPGGSASFSYRLPRALTEQAMAKFASPEISVPDGGSKGTRGAKDDIAASMAGILPIGADAAGYLLVLAGIGIIALMIFGAFLGKSEQKNE